MNANQKTRAYYNFAVAYPAAWVSGLTMDLWLDSCNLSIKKGTNLAYCNMQEVYDTYLVVCAEYFDFNKITKALILYLICSNNS